MAPRTNQLVRRAFRTNKETAEAVRHTFTSNISSIVRTETFEGAEHLVAPLIMINEGVHNRLFYPGAQLAKSAPAWNGRTVTVYHPTNLDGNRVPVGDPRTIEQFGTGTLFNSEYVEDGHKLRAEVWLNKAKAEATEAGRDVLAKLAKNEMIEVSTGLFLEEDAVKGVWNETDEYDATVINYSPDHLALLPNTKGACSIDDGAGFPRCNEAETVTMPSKVTRWNRLKEWFAQITLNRDASIDERREALIDALRNEPGLPANSWLWIEDMREETIVYSLEKAGNPPQFFQRGYAVDADGAVSLSDNAPQEVEKVVEYRPKKEILAVNRTEIITALIANEDQKWTEVHKPFLEGLEDEQLELISGAKPLVPDGTPAPVIPAINENTSTSTMEEWRKSAPPEITAVFDTLQASQETKATALRTSLAANARCTFTEGDMKAMDLTTLEKLAESLGGAADYTGNAPGTAPNLADNAEDAIPAPKRVQYVDGKPQLIAAE